MRLQAWNGMALNLWAISERNVMHLADARSF